MEAFLEAMQEEFDYYDDKVTRLRAFYTELPIYQEVFESEDEEIQETNAKNVEIEKQSTNLIEKMIATVKKIFNKAKELIKSVFTWLKSSKDEKSAFRQFQKECKENPEFANKKVTMKEWKKINDIREKHLSGMEADYRKLKDEEAENKETVLTDAQNAVKKMAKEVGEVITSEGAAVTMVGALNYAKQSQACAAKVQMMIDHDFGLIDVLEKKLTKKEVRRFKRKVRGIQIRLKILNFIGRGRCDQAKSLRECIADVTKKGTDMMKAQRIAMKNKATKNAARDVVDIGAGTTKEVGTEYAKKRMKLRRLERLDKEATKKAEGQKKKLQDEA